MSEPRRLGEIINPTLSKLETSDGARAYGLWARAAGDSVAANARPRRFARGLLTLECASSIWANELTYLAPQILARMAELEADNPVRRLRFVTARSPFGPGSGTEPALDGPSGGTAPQQARDAAAQPSKQVPGPAAANPKGRERRARDGGSGAAEEAARHVDDERLRAAILASLPDSPRRSGPSTLDGPSVNHK